MVAVEVVVVSAPSVLADGPVFLTSTAITSPVFALSAGITGVLALALISSVAAVIGDFAAVVAAGAAWVVLGVAWVVLGATSSAETIVVPVKTVPKTTDAKVKVCLREIVNFFKIRPLFNKLFSIIQVFEKLVNGIIIKGFADFYIPNY